MRSALLAAVSRALSPGQKAGLWWQRPALRTHPGGPTFLWFRWPWHAAGAGRGPELGGPARPPGSRGLSQRCPRAASQTQPATTCKQKQCGQAGTWAPALAPALWCPQSGRDSSSRHPNGTRPGPGLAGGGGAARWAHRSCRSKAAVRLGRSSSRWSISTAVPASTSAGRSATNSEVSAGLLQARNCRDERAPPQSPRSQGQNVPFTVLPMILLASALTWCQ